MPMTTLKQDESIFFFTSRPKLSFWQRRRQQQQQKHTNDPLMSLMLVHGFSLSSDVMIYHANTSMLKH
jgi:hypothetical protein